MARTYGPLLSQTATGTIGKALTFRQTKRGVYAMPYTGGRPPVTGTQLALAQLTRAASKIWRLMDADTQALWTALGAQRQIPGIAAYTADAYNQMIQGTCPRPTPTTHYTRTGLLGTLTGSVSKQRIVTLTYHRTAGTTPFWIVAWSRQGRLISETISYLTPWDATADSGAATITWTDTVPITQATTYNAITTRDGIHSYESPYYEAYVP